jgi:hypothetical protein
MTSSLETSNPGNQKVQLSQRNRKQLDNLEVVDLAGIGFFQSLKAKEERDLMEAKARALNAKNGMS